MFTFYDDKSLNRKKCNIKYLTKFKNLTKFLNKDWILQILIYILKSNAFLIIYLIWIFTKTQR